MRPTLGESKNMGVATSVERACSVTIHPMDSTIYGKMRATKYSGPAVLEAPRAMPRKGSVPVNPHDTADAPVRIPLSSRKYPNLFALVDAEDADRVLAEKNWTPKFARSGVIYARSGRSRSQIHLHRFVLGLSPCDLDVDHINGNGLNNRRSNLRVCSQQQNQVNTSYPRSSTSRFRGVRWSNGSRKWCATSSLNGKKKHLGYFVDEWEAALVYDKFRADHFGDFARPNIPNLAEWLYEKDQGPLQ